MVETRARLAGFMTVPAANAPLRIHFTASPRRGPQSQLRRLQAMYGSTPDHSADVVVMLGGDGFMLETIHHFMGRGLPVFGMNCGTVGFLLNEYREDGLQERLAQAERATVRPLRAVGRDVRGRPFTMLAVNEVSLLRETRQTAKLQISIDGVERLGELAADGCMVATPAGSTAYNFSAHGPILPIGSRLLALTPISAFRPRRWRGALLSSEAVVRFDVHDPDTRPVSAVADNQEVRDVAHVTVSEDRDLTVDLLFDAGHDLQERILREQFAH